MILQFFHFSLIAGDRFFHVLLPLADRLAFPFPVTFVAHDILKIFVGIDVLAPYNFRGVSDYIFRQSDFPCDLYSKGASRVTDLQLEECLH